jgi:hypothetical protein
MLRIPFAQKRGSTARSRRLRFWEVQSRDRASDTTGITLFAHEALDRIGQKSDQMV